MLYRIKANYRVYFNYPPTSIYDLGGDEWESSVESPLSNSVASFRKWVIEDLGISEETFPRDLEKNGIALNFSRQPHQIYDPDNFVHDNQREFLNDDETLQYDEVIYIDFVHLI